MNKEEPMKINTKYVDAAIIFLMLLTIPHAGIIFLNVATYDLGLFDYLPSFLEIELTIFILAYTRFIQKKSVEQAILNATGYLLIYGLFILFALIS